MNTDRIDLSNEQRSKLLVFTEGDKQSDAQQSIQTSVVHVQVSVSTQVGNTNAIIKHRPSHTA